MIFEHFATNPDPVTEFIKLGYTGIFEHFDTN
jgi:hypothetical protein